MRRHSNPLFLSKQDTQRLVWGERRPSKRRAGPRDAPRNGRKSPLVSVLLTDDLS